MADAVTDAQLRVLMKAREAGYVMIYGAFSGTGERGFNLEMSTFDRRRHVETLIAKRLLCTGRSFNQYILSVSGNDLLNDMINRRMSRRLKAAAPGIASKGAIPPAATHRF